MTRARLYHNADCSKCRAALDLLLARDVDVEIISYLQHPPSAADLRELLRRLGLPARDLLRRSIPEAAHLLDPGIGEDAVLDALHANPAWLQRPIFVIGDRAVIARPPERMLDLLPK